MSFLMELMELRVIFDGIDGIACVFSQQMLIFTKSDEIDFAILMELMELRVIFDGIDGIACHF